MLIMLFLSRNVQAQEIIFDPPYRLDVNPACKITATVTKGNRMILQLNKNALRGTLTKNRNQPASYDFFVKNQFRFVVLFGKGEPGPSLTIANGEYLKLFTPCNNGKYFTLYTAARQD